MRLKIDVVDKKDLGVDCTASADCASTFCDGPVDAKKCVSVGKYIWKLRAQSGMNKMFIEKVAKKYIVKIF